MRTSFRMVGRICAFFVLSATAAWGKMAPRATALRARRGRARAGGQTDDDRAQDRPCSLPDDHAARSRRTLRGVLADAGRGRAPVVEGHAAVALGMGPGAAARHAVRR